MAGFELQHHMTMQPTEADDHTTAAAQVNSLSKFFITPFEFKVTYFVVGGLGMAGNLMVLVVILCNAHLRATFTNKFITNQSLIDFLSSFFILVTNAIRDPAPEVLGDGVFQDLWCLLWMTKWPMWGSFISSTFNLVAMTFERYYAIVYPLHHSHSFTNTKAYILMALAWVCGLGLHASYGVSTTTRTDGTCRTFVYPSVLIRRSVVVIILLVQFLTPIISITMAYIHIFITLRKAPKASAVENIQDPREERMKKARKNVIKTLVKVFLCFVCCWTPNQVFYVGMMFGYEFTPDATYYHITVLLVFVNSIINPFVYTMTYQQFQKAQMALFCPVCLNTAGPSQELTSSSKEDHIKKPTLTSMTDISCNTDTTVTDVKNK